MHLLSSPQEQRGYGWEYLTGCYHLFILPQAIYQTLSKISRVRFPQTRSFDVLRPNVFFREVSSYFPKTETILFYSFCLSCLTVLTYFPYFFNWRFHFQNKQKVISLSTFSLTSMCDDANGSCGVCLSCHCILREFEMNHIAFWYSLTLSVCNLLLIVYNCFKVWFPFHWFSWN